MGIRGPAPKPQTLKDLEGNPGKRRRNKAAPKPTGEPEPPDVLKGYAREVWDRLIGSMPPRLYTPADVELLTAYCLTSAQMHKAARKLEEEDAVVVSSAGAPYQNPWISIQNKSAQLLATLGTRLGLDPAARNNLQVPPEEKPKSKFEGLISITGGRNE